MKTTHYSPSINKYKFAILVPIYKDSLSTIEQYSLDQSLHCVQNENVSMIAPIDLNTTYYENRYPWVDFQKYENNFFESIQGYNQLLLSEEFYIQYLQYEFILILQTDAILIKDDLNYWCSQPFDFIGAPFPDGIEVLVNAGSYEGNNSKRVRAHVGNGGLSLRRTRKCLALLREHSIFVSIFLNTGSSEDLFFSLMGQLSQHFILPNEVIASQFAMELRPSFYYAINGNRLPMGGHAWWKYEPEFWEKILPDAPILLLNRTDLP